MVHSSPPLTKTTTTTTTATPGTSTGLQNRGEQQDQPPAVVVQRASSASPRSAASSSSRSNSLLSSRTNSLASTRSPAYKSRLQDLEQIHDNIRRRLAAKKGLPPPDDLTKPSGTADKSLLADKSLNTADTKYSDVVSSYTLGNVRSALAPTVYGPIEGDSESEESYSTLSPGFSDSSLQHFIHSPLTDFGDELFDDDDTVVMAKKAKGEQQDKKDEAVETTETPETQDDNNDSSDSFASADEQDSRQETTKSTLDVDSQPAFAQTRSMVDVTIGDEDASLVEEPEHNAADENDEPSTPKQKAIKAEDPDTLKKLEPLEIPTTEQQIPPNLPPRPDETETAPHDVPPPPSPPKRKFTSPFSFFSRGSSSGSKPNGLVRSDTFASTASVSTANGDGENDNEATPRRPNRQSLRDRFKLLRMQEETGLVIDESETSRPGSQSGDNDASEVVFSPKEDVDRQLARDRKSSGATDAPVGGPTLNEQLPAGTAVGTATGPARTQEPVDWDLWQAVVYEGPAAVARSSKDELNRAIAHGIPSAIRGVVWQVLADSKNEELETVYRELVARNEREISTRRSSETKSSRPALSRPQSMADSARDAASSSRASVHSGTSPASTDNEAAVLSPTSSVSTSAETIAKAQAKLAAEQKQKQKEEAAALQKLERAIKRDMGARTSYSKFLMSQGLQDGLFGICKAYALYDEEVGYAQGMNFIAMPLLFNMPEEEAFTLFVRLMNHYHLRDLFVAEMPGLHLHLYQFARLLEDFEPAVYCHLNRRGVHPQLYATQWFLTLFAYRFPLQLVLRIYDLIIAEGLESAILKFGIVLMRKNARQLLEMRDMAMLTTFLKERLFDVYIDKTPSATSVLESGFFGSAGGIDREVYMADRLVQDACDVSVTKEMLATYTREWEERTAEEKAAQLERESLRAQNASLALQVRQLRQRTEQLDDEHVQMASELVRTKVHNQQLVDDNESLRTNVKELQGIISAQPGEVEERLRAEMDRIIARNGEVQNQNRALEEEREQVEGELVRAKLEKAEMSSEVEALRQKWSHVSGLMAAATAPKTP